MLGPSLAQGIDVWTLLLCISGCIRCLRHLVYSDFWHIGIRIGRRLACNWQAFHLGHIGRLRSPEEMRLQISSSATNGSPGINLAQTISNGGGCRLLSVCTAKRLVIAWKRLTYGWTSSRFRYSTTAARSSLSTPSMSTQPQRTSSRRLMHTLTFRTLAYVCGDAALYYTCLEAFACCEAPCKPLGSDRCVGVPGDDSSSTMALICIL